MSVEGRMCLRKAKNTKRTQFFAYPSPMDTRFLLITRMLVGGSRPSPMRKSEPI